MERNPKKHSLGKRSLSFIPSQTPTDKGERVIFAVWHFMSFVEVAKNGTKYCY